MRTTILILFFGFLSSKVSAQITFEKVIDTLGCYNATCIKQTFDGGYVFCSSSTSNDALIVKLDMAGTLQWVKSYGGAWPGYIDQTPDSGYMVHALYKDSSGAENWLLRLNANGDSLWSKTLNIGTGNVMIAQNNSMASMNGGTYGLTGYISNTSQATGYLISCLSDGTVLSNNIYNFYINGVESRAIDATYDFGFILAGSAATSSSNADAYLIRTNVFGDTLWTRTYGMSNVDAAQAVQQTADSGFIFTGITYHAIQGHYDMYLVKTDAFGDTAWTKSYHSASGQVEYAIQQTTDGGYIITGNIYDIPNIDRNLHLVKTDANGDTLWTRMYGGATIEDGYFVQQTSDGGYIICGVTQSFSVGSYIIKTDSLGLVASGLGTVETANPDSFLVFPNPSSGIFTIRRATTHNRNAIIEIYNLLNKCIYSCSLTGNTIEQIDLTHLPGGIYYAVMSAGQKMTTQKIIIQK